MSVQPSLKQTSSGFVENEGVETHFYVTGEGPLMVFQHGFPDNASTWYHQVAEFSKTHTVVCPTLLAGDILAILDHFNAPKAIIAGHDFGGAAIQLLALLHPERVSELITINSPIVPRIYELVNFDKDQQRQSEYTISYMKYQPGDDKNLDVVVAPISDEEYRRNIRNYLSESPMEGMLAYYKYNYPAPPYGVKVDTSVMLYQVPTLIIWGVDDPYFSLKMLDQIPKNFKNTTRLVTLPGAGHWSFREQPDRINQEIRSWLELHAMGSI
ncbi:Epoxide hydrolase [Colletotrichum higginsianum IMI 349063]|uniref:Epoxide hydrolase n=1 Tax=Colletotrichum higginsianum (strain IMI 349063) TaxID=759273 RepID=A0A1B7XVW1_COLHI|nr:Epoxide hydrolase [Colletotrichum higginsianum IMI 349063]OBR03919.1 Epoxide hydrolase [Colletotrichum higginsianum IMI 349063]GJD03715.1 epoxide hydrolase [Colletotrichum higginsianum]